MVDLDQTARAVLYGIVAGPAFASIVATWRRGLLYGFACGFFTLLFMATLLFPIYLGFLGITFRLS
jgi:hypothetical protein